MSDTDRDEYSTPTLMRFARGVYAQAIRAQLHAAGLQDMPSNGAFILAGIDGSGGPRNDLPSELGVSKQAVSQAIDQLVDRGYVERGHDPDDRRRIPLQLTARGEQALATTSEAIDLVEAKLAELVSREQIDAARSVLFAMTKVKADALASGAGRPASTRTLTQISPIFPVSNLTAALAHYEALGFKTSAYVEGEDYGFASRDRVGLHLQAEPPPLRPSAAYLYVRSADALYTEWTSPGIGGTTSPVFAAPWGLREGRHEDPDGNLIRFGSPIFEGPDH